ncbi:hypothetical protein BEN78_11715 [Xanthomonas citri pv. mangiferaeindicae]|nr:hypothetical protein BEN78_11715 [Xanthomonas citri pv. mangiferaeindicae]
MSKLDRNLLSVALSSALLMLATGAHAQTTTSTSTNNIETASTQTPASGGDAVQLDSVRVTGIRRGIELSMDTKQAEDTIVEAISAEDIGKLPDTSIADSLSRLPGISAQRFGGRPQELNIRGFAGDFSTALLNGREQVSFGNNRGVEFDQYPSELISQVVVHKTTNAQLVGQGLSGTVNMKTVRPLSFGERAIAVNVRGDMNKLGDDKEYGSRASISYIDQFADNTVGIAVGYARLDSPNLGHQFESWNFNKEYPGYAGNAVLGGTAAYAIEGSNRRDGYMAVLEFQPNERLHSTIDLFYSQFDRQENKYGLQTGLAYGRATLDDATLSPNGTTIDSTWSQIAPIVLRNDSNTMDDRLLSFGWNTELEVNANWTLTTDVSHSRARRAEQLFEVYATPPAGVTSSGRYVFNPEGWYDIDLDYDLGAPGGFVLRDPDRWGGERDQAGYLKNFEVRDQISAFRIDLERRFDAGFVSALRFGGNITDRRKSRASTEYTLCVTDACTGDLSVAIPGQYVRNSAFGFAGIPSILDLDERAMLAAGVYRPWRKDDAAINDKNWEIHEEIATLYVQADIDTDLGPVPLKGNVGVQVVNASQRSTGVATFEGAALEAPSERGADHVHYLPSMNLSFGLPAEQFVRVGASRQMARPRMDELTAGGSYSIDRSRDRWTGSGGNPELDPWLANAYDLSYEKYFGNESIGRGYVSAAYFYKDLKTYIYRQTTAFDFSQLPLPPELPGNLPPSWIGEYSQPVNGEGGTIKGWEFAVSLPLGLLWAPLEGFGFMGNYSDTESDIAPNGPDSSEPLPGLSKYVSNVALYYERYGFSARVSQRSRSDFLGEVQGAGGDRTKVMFTGETVTDLQLGYAFESGRLEGLSLLLQVNNLENEPFRSTFDGLQERPNQFYDYGRTYLMGVNYRF